MDINKLKSQLAAMQEEINRTAEQYGLGGHLQRMLNGGEIHQLPVMPYGFAKQGSYMTNTKVYSPEELKTMKLNQATSIVDAMRLGWVALKTNTTKEMREGQDLLSDAGLRFESQTGRFNAKDYGPPEGYFKKLVTEPLGIEDETFFKGINGYATFASVLGNRPIMAMDEVTKFLGYRAELYANAFRASEKAKRQARLDGKTGDEVEDIGLKAMGDMFANTPKEVEDVAKDFSHMLTFSRALTGKAKAIQELASESLIGRINLPFVKTPIWVTSESMQNSMIAPLSSQWRKDMAEGGAKRELAMAKWGMGSGIMIGVGSMVADGRVTGGGPANQKVLSNSIFN